MLKFLNWALQSLGLRLSSIQDLKQREAAAEAALAAAEEERSLRTQIYGRLEALEATTQKVAEEGARTAAREQERAAQLAGIERKVDGVVSASAAHVAEWSRRFDQAEMDARMHAYHSLPFGVFVGNDRLLTKTTYGTSLLLHADDLMMAPSIMTNRKWEPELSDLLYRLLRPGMNFLDIGANIGYFSVMAGSILRGQGRVDAFEPNPRTYALLADNVKMNWLFDGVQTHQAAVADQEGILTLHCRRKNSGGSSLMKRLSEGADFEQETTEPVSVRTVALDQYLPSDYLPSIVKIDVEGAEPLAFKGMAGLAGRASDFCMFAEWNETGLREGGFSTEDYLGFVQQQGLTIRLLEDNCRVYRPEQVAKLGFGNLLLTRGEFDRAFT
ncbi:MAG: FkbM family methyltransferase [Verrucomicrobia bacterium]|nr:FkbM family methyltransferase [Verrucomicrobiota bacterium]